MPEWVYAVLGAVLVVGCIVGVAKLAEWLLHDKGE